WAVTHDMFLSHWEKGYIYKDAQKQLYSLDDQRWLPDRYVEGVCPYCGYEGARGDQCDNCGRTYDAVELINPRSRISGGTNIEVRETEHFFFNLGKVNRPLLEWINDGCKDHWRPNVLNFTRSQLESGELRGRPITRDMEWGITIPLPGYESKRIYVWYEAVIGYLSASKEWARLVGEPEKWHEWWDLGNGAKTYYFIGKDNIPFHAIIWPGMLYAYGGLNLPWDVPANEYLNMYGRKFSKSRGYVIHMLDVLERYDPDPWRYVLTALAPENTDVDFTWDDFLTRVNNELVANWGNLVNRVLGFAYKRFEGRVPTPGDLDEADRAILNTVRGGFDSVGGLLGLCKFKAGLAEAQRLSQEVNRYLNEKEPWRQIKTDSAAAATSIYVALQTIDWLKTIYAPFLPHTSQQLHEFLGYEGQLFGRQYTEVVEEETRSHLVLRYDSSQAIGRWEPGKLPPGQILRQPRPLFKKLDESVIEQETVPKEGA
ncbi:MAG TPA: methionine--tRNA ligase, partial [Anaerolineae bacterium]|nr:methionine--tRNA ligase [Anaerolineae bacterium]